MPDKFDHPKLANLPDATRTRVEAALKETLERQLSAAAGAASPVAAHSRSQGAFFSRSKTTDQMRGRDDDSVLLDKVTTLDDANFAKFTERLTQIKTVVKGVK